MQRPYISWCPGLEDDDEALAVVAESSVVAGIETSGMDAMRRIQQRGVQVSLHNIVRWGVNVIDDPLFHTNFSSPELIVAAQSDALTLGFHLPDSFSGDFDEMCLRIAKNVLLLNEIFPEKMIVLEVVYVTPPGHPEGLRTGHELKSGYEVFCTPKNLSRLFQILNEQCTNVSFLLDVAHASITAVTCGCTSWQEVGDWIIELVSAISCNVGQVHITVPSGDLPELSDAHALLDDTTNSELVFRVVSKVLSRTTPHTLTLEMDTKLPPVEHVHALIAQAKLFTARIEMLMDTVH